MIHCAAKKKKGGGEKRKVRDDVLNAGKPESQGHSEPHPDPPISHQNSLQTLHKQKEPQCLEHTPVTHPDHQPQNLQAEGRAQPNQRLACTHPPAPPGLAAFQAGPFPVLVPRAEGGW